MVPIRKNCDSESPKGILKTLVEYALAHSQLPQRHLLSEQLIQVFLRTRVLPGLFCNMYWAKGSVTLQGETNGLSDHEK